MLFIGKKALCLFIGLLFYSNLACTEDLDKKEHFVVSYIISTGALVGADYLHLKHPRVWAFGTTLAIGYMKELSDTEVDEQDMVFNALGAATPLLLTWSF